MLTGTQGLCRSITPSPTLRHMRAASKILKMLCQLSAIHGHLDSASKSKLACACMFQACNYSTRTATDRAHKHSGWTMQTLWCSLPCVAVCLLSVFWTAPASPPGNVYIHNTFQHSSTYQTGVRLCQCVNHRRQSYGKFSHGMFTVLS